MKKFLLWIMVICTVCCSFFALGCGDDEKPNYGTLTVTPSVNELYINYPGIPLSVEFSKPEYAEEVEYSFQNVVSAYDVDVVVENGVLSVNGKLMRDERAEEEMEISASILAKTSKHSTTFSITLKQYNGLNSSGSSLKLDERATGFAITANSSPENATFFIGDSFFDEGFWNGSDFYDTYDGINAHRMGVSASTLSDWMVISERVVFPYNPKNIVMHIGSNDYFDDGMAPQRIANNLKSLVNDYHKRIPGVKVYWFSIEPRKTNTGEARDGANRTNEIMKAFAEENDWFVYIDSHRWCFVDDERTTINADFYRDNVHPKKGSYALYVQALIDAGIEYSSN